MGWRYPSRLRFRRLLIGRRRPDAVAVRRRIVSGGPIQGTNVTQPTIWLPAAAHENVRVALRDAQLEGDQLLSRHDRLVEYGVYLSYGSTGAVCVRRGVRDNVLPDLPGVLLKLRNRSLGAFR